MKLTNIIVSVVLGGAGLYFICAQTHWTVALGMILFTWSNNFDIMTRIRLDENEKLAEDIKQLALEVIKRERRDGGLLAPAVINNTTINGGQ